MNQTNETTGPTVLVTGGHPGADLFVIDDFRSSSFANLVEACDRAGVGPFAGTVHGWSTNEIDWEEVIDAISPDAVFHLAAITDTTVMDERIMLEGNVEGFRDLMIATAGREIPRGAVQLVCGSTGDLLSHLGGSVEAVLEADANGQLGAFQNQDDSPACPNCGGITVRAGSCYSCPNCGSSTGCG